MKGFSSRYAFVLVIGAVTLCNGWVARADDKALFSTFVRDPNVLVVLDSGGTTTQNANNDQHLLACGDDPASKLFQEKAALKWMLEQYPNCNYGFSYSYKDDPVKVHYLNYLYQVAEIIDTNLLAPAANFSALGAEMRMGAQTDVWHNTAVPPQYPIRYGQDGLNYYYSPAYGVASHVKSYILDSARTNKKNAAGDPYYYPAYDWNAIPLAIQNGLKGTTTWATVSTSLGSGVLGIVYPNAGWERALRDYVTGVIASAQFGSQDLYIKEVEESCTKSGSNWTCTETGRYQKIRVHFVRQFLLYDRAGFADDSQQISSSETLTALEWKTPGVDCNSGYMLQSAGGYIPIVPVPPPGPAPACETGDNKPWMKSFLESQTRGAWYFPNSGLTSPYLPSERANLIPWTDTVQAGGRRALSKLLNDADRYFRDNVMTQPAVCEKCRQNFVFILTDGLESCASATAPCQQGKNMAPGLSVFVIAWLPANLSSTLRQAAEDQLTCITAFNQGKWWIVSDETSLRKAMEEMQGKIIERNAAFAAPSVPSVELSTREKGYISTFFAVRDRSIWEGHLRAYLVDTKTGTVPVTCATTSTGNTLCVPDETQALWDAAVPLATLTNAEVLANSGKRRFYFATNAPSGTPGTRYAFQPGTTTVLASDYLLYNRIIQPAVPYDPVGNPLTTAVRDTDLTPLVNFIRGYRSDPVLYRFSFPKSTTATGKLARLGDIFHSVPVISGKPDCYQCPWSQLGDYSAYIAKHQWRRKVLFVGANDGAFHAIDAGFTYLDGSTRKYDDGTGQELFAWVPNGIMWNKNLYFTAAGTSQVYTLDGSPSVGDVFIDPTHNGSPTLSEREWRTVVMFGERSGGRSVVCLDVTQPDTYDTNGIPQKDTDGFPSCLSGASQTACGNRDYPALLWEFTDPAVDASGNPDLGQTWSKPAIAIVKVHAAASTTEDSRFVAIFGGGYWPGFAGGDYLYMVDIETGKTLFKFPMPSAVPGEVGVLDTNFDGYPERLYWTDTAGNFWRMNMRDESTKVTLASPYDASGLVTCSADPVGSLDSFSCGSGGWTIQRIFKNTDGSFQPIFHRPVIVYTGNDASEVPQFAIGAGSGDRENIRSLNTVPHRFYFMRDPGGSTGLPLTLANLQAVNLTDANTSFDFLQTNGTITTYGWYLILGTYEKVNTPAVSIEGKVIFSTFTPDPTVLDGPDGTCVRKGSARTYVLDYTNANPAPVGSTSRYTQFDDTVLMVSEPIVYVGEDGKLHVLQSTDNLALSQPIAPTAVHGTLTTWRER